MESFVSLAGLAHSELVTVGDELDLQTEKYIQLQKKLGSNRTILDRSRLILIKLEEATKMRRILLSMLVMLAVFVTLLLLIRYGRLP